MVFRSYYLKPLIGKPESRFSPNIVAFDVENNPDTSEFILASVYGTTLKRSNHKYKETTVKETFFSKEAFQKFLMDLRPQEDIDKQKRHPCVLIAFNTAYDMGFLDEIEDSVARIDGTHFITTKLKNGLKVIDLTNHLMDSLKNNVEVFKREIPDIEKTNLPESTDIQKMALHCEADAKATYEIAHYVFNDFYADHAHLTPTYTKAGMALQSFRRFALKETWKNRSSDINDFERSGYYGGRCEIFHRGENLNTVSFDVNSMYPSRAVKELLPDPQTVIRGSGYNINFKDYFRSRDMMIECTIEVPKQKICPLPYRMNGKLVFPYGVLHGVWASPELIYAIDKCNCKIISIDKWMAYEEQIDDLKNYMLYWYHERLNWRAKGNKAMETLCKYFLNSLTGKFGEHIRDNKLVKVEDIPLTTDLTGCATYDWNDEEYVELKSMGWEDTDHTFPVIIAFITAYSRVHLLKAMKSIEKDVVYCDTDSVHCFKTAKEQFETLNWVSNDKKDLGAFSYEGEHTQFYYRPKMYGTHIKGINLKKAIKTYEDDGEVAYAIRKPNRRRTSIKRNLIVNQWVWTEKVLSKWDDKRDWNNDGTSNPIMIDIHQ